MEILRQHPARSRRSSCRSGGGGLVAGIAAYVKRCGPRRSHRRRARGRRRHGQLARAPAARDARPGRPVRRRRRGAAGRRGDASGSAASYVDEIVTVDTDEICAAIKDIFEDTRAVLGARRARWRWPALKRYAERDGPARAAPRRDQQRRQPELRPPALHRRARRARRAARGAARRSRSPSGPGSFLRFIAGARASAASPSSTTATRRAPTAQMFVGVELGGGQREKQRAHRARCARPATASLDMSDNEMAKLHVRYMVGGPRPRALARRAAVPLRVPGAAGRADEVPRGAAAPAGTSRCSTTATTAPTTAACSPASQVPPAERRAVRHALIEALGYPLRDETAIRPTGCSSTGGGCGIGLTGAGAPRPHRAPAMVLPWKTALTSGRAHDFPARQERRRGVLSRWQLGLPISSLDSVPEPTPHASDPSRPRHRACNRRPPPWRRRAGDPGACGRRRQRQGPLRRPRHRSVVPGLDHQAR